MNENIRIIENGTVVTCDPQRRMGAFTILIKGDRVAEVSNRGDLLRSLHPNAEVIDARGKLIVPGFVDAHCHGESALLRHFTALKPLVQWSKSQEVKRAFEYIYQKADVQDLSVAYRLAYFSALKSGVTSIAEFCFDNLDRPLTAAFEAMKRADLRGVIGLHNGDQIERARRLIHPSIRFAVVLPSEEDLTTYNLQNTVRLASDLKLPLIIHSGETKRGLENIRRNFQRSTVKLLYENRLFESSILAVHFAALEPGDVDVLANVNARVILTPRSVFLKGTEYPSVTELLHRNISIVLASDWGVADPFENIRAFVSIAAGQGIDNLQGEELVRMVTCEAAKALGIHDSVGSLETNKKADLTFIDCSSPRFAGLAHREPASALASTISEATYRDVSDVMINGEFFVREHHVMTYSEEDLAKESAELMNKIHHYVVEQKVPGAPGISKREESPKPFDGGEMQGDVEGFRIVPKTFGKLSPDQKIIPLPVETHKKTELPNKAKRVFGDDDL